jgi:hypothetical protein
MPGVACNRQMADATWIFLGQKMESCEWGVENAFLGWLLISPNEIRKIDEDIHP